MADGVSIFPCDKPGAEESAVGIIWERWLLAGVGPLTLVTEVEGDGWCESVV